MIPVRRILSLFERKERARLVGLLLMLVVGALLETAGVGLVMPFISLVSDPGLAARNAALRWLHDAVGARSPSGFLLVCGGLLLVFYVLKNAYLALVVFLQNRLVYGKMHALSRRLFDAYLRAPYRFHLARNTAELQRNVNTDVPLLFNWVVAQSFICASDLLVVAVVTGLLLLLDPLAALGALAVFTAGAAIFLRAVRRWTHRLGRREQESFGRMIKWVNQGLGGIKETKVLGHERFFADAYAESSGVYTRARRTIQTVTELPRLFFETIAIGGMVAVILTFLAQDREIRSILPTLALFAAAAFRLMPALTRILRTANLVKHFRVSLDVVHSDLALLAPEGPEGPGPGEPVPFEEAIELRDVTFRYSRDAEPVLRGVSLRIARDEAVGFTGASGAGKTTIVDLVLGLFPPDEGEVLADGVPVSRDVRAWQRNFGYIPQEVYLLDDTIRRNVAYGRRDEEIDDGAVRRALDRARLLEFTDRLPEGLDTRVGERGVSLSGGQRQRIGIARALYGDPPILVLDEATSSLDRETEREIGETIRGLRGGRTILVIAHRLETVRGCDRIFFLEGGRIAAEGSFEEVAAGSPEFRRMAGLGEGERRD